MVLSLPRPKPTAKRPLVWLSLLLALGSVACDDDDVPPDLTPSPSGSGGSGGNATSAATTSTAGNGGAGVGGGLGGEGGMGGATSGSGGGGATGGAATGGAGGSGGVGGGASVPAPAVGDVVISEVMVDPETAPINSLGGYVELTNVSGTALDLGDCELLSGGGAAGVFAFADPTVIGTHYVIAGGDPGFVPDATFGVFALIPTVGNLELRCGISGTPYAVDTAMWDITNGTFPTAGTALSVDPSNLNASANDNPGDWCAATTFLRNKPSSNPFIEINDFGTPGSANDACVLPGTVTDCALISPLDYVDSHLLSIDVVAAIKVNGYTTLTSAGNEPKHPLIDANPIHGTGSNPTMWTLGNPMVPTATFPAIASDADGYTSTTNPPAQSAVRLGVRVTADGGQTFAHCDSDGLPFEIASAGYAMTVTPFIHISELAIVNGGSTRVVELFNPRSMESNMSFCELQIFTDGASPPTVIDLPNIPIPAGGVYTVCNAGETCDHDTDSGPDLVFDGNDTLVVSCTNTVYDAVGQTGTAAAWSTGDVVLRRDCLPGGDPVEDDVFDVTRHWNPVLDINNNPDPSGLGSAACP